jgi:hypothetical protein
MKDNMSYEILLDTSSNGYLYCMANSSFLGKSES